MGGHKDSILYCALGFKQYIQQILFNTSENCVDDIEWALCSKTNKIGDWIVGLVCLQEAEHEVGFGSTVNSNFNTNITVGKSK